MPPPPPLGARDGEMRYPSAACPRSFRSERGARRLTVERTAEYLGISPKAVRGRIDRGRLPAVRDGRRVFVDRQALDKTFADEEEYSPAVTTESPRTAERPGARPQEVQLP